MKSFDKEYMKRNKNHSCKTKEKYDDSTWYCDHLIDARLRKFKEEIKHEDSLLKCMISSQLPTR